MTTILTQAQTDALRSIGDGALVLFAMVLVDSNFPGRATKPEELLPYLHPTYKDVRKLRTQMEALSASNRLAKKGTGYVLLEGGRALVLSMAPALSESTETLALSPESTSGTVLEAQTVEVDGAARKLRALKKEEEEILRIKSHESTSSDLSTQNVRALEIAPGVTTERILLATSSLEGFGEGVFLHGLDHANIHPRMALGWIAQAYTERGRLESPAGLVYSRLKDAKEPKPRVKYYEGWESFLPDEFLQVIGLLELTCRACDQTFETVEAFKEHQAFTMKCEMGCGASFHRMEDLEAHHATHTPAVDMYTLLDDGSRGAKAWQMVKAELAVDIPKASFDTWVKDADAVGFEAGQLMVCVRNAYARDWLADRLTAKIETMLKNFTHETIKVRFVVGVVDVEEAHDSE